VAAGVAERLGDRVRRVALVSTFTRTRPIALRLSACISSFSPARLYRFVTPPLMALTCGPVGDGRQHPFLTEATRSDRRSVARRTRWQVGRNVSAELRAIRQPTLVVMGARDRFVPHRRRELHRLASIFTGPGRRLVTIESAGHVLLPSAAIQQAIDELTAFFG
jgi:pimeloyl-ACP methyl ester carboxylesterase